MTNNDAAKPQDLPEKILHYINGEFVPSIDGDEFEVIDPVTNKPYIKAASGKPEDVDKAVAAANDAFKNGPWSSMLLRERARVLDKIADVVESRAEVLASWESFDSGLPITQATGQAKRAAENFRFFSDLIDRKSTRLNSSHVSISYAVFCLKKKNDEEN